MEENINYLYSLSERGSHPGLSRIIGALSDIGNIQNKLSVIAVTGTNGKGSVCAMLSQILSKKYKVGVFSSPYLEKINESITVGGRDIGDSELSLVIGEIRDISEKYSLTQFEVLTVAAIVFFAKENVDIAVMEVGMGGRGDATNVFSSNIMTVITGVSLDHTNFLGSTKEDIAREKAGLIKPGCPVYYGGDDESVAAVIKGVADENKSEFFRKNNSLEALICSPERNTFLYNGKTLTMHCSGLYQLENAAKTLDCLEIIAKRGYTVSDDDIISGFSEVKRRARFEVFSLDPYIIFDGGHNPECIDAFVKSYKRYFGTRRCNVITGVMKDKDYAYMVKELSGIAASVYTLAPDNPRALDPETLKDEFLKYDVKAASFDNFDAALENALKSGRPVVCVGSLYSYKEFKAAIKNRGGEL